MVAGIAVALILLGAAVWFFYLRSDAPPEVDLGTATEQLTSTTAPEGSTTTVADDGIAGTWVVDSESGEFDFESATGSFAGFRVTEELASIGKTEAVGRTGEVTGEMVIDGTTLSSTEISVNLTELQSDKPRRDDKVLEALMVKDYPNATFDLTEPVDLGNGAAEGDDLSVEATGNLTIHGVTREVTVELDSQLVDGTAVVVGSIPIKLADYDVETPSAPVVLSVSDDATIEFQLLFKPQDSGELTEPDPTGATTTSAP